MEPLIHTSPDVVGRFRPRRLRYLLLLALALPLCGCIELLGALVGGCMFITDPLLAELGVPTNANPNPCSKLSGGLRYVVTDQAILYQEDSRTNLALDKGTELKVLENCRINLRVATPNGDIGWVLQLHVSSEPIEAEPPKPADKIIQACRTLQNRQQNGHFLRKWPFFLTSRA